MANTLKFGNGEWYGKEDTILAYNDLNSNYKPLPFDFSRGSSATVINKDGLIETVGSGEPRIDYKDDSKGAMLLEPSRTNYLSYSEDFSYWTIGGSVTVTDNQIISPDGTLNASILDFTSAISSSGVYRFSGDRTGSLSRSIYLKGAVGGETIDLSDPHMGGGSNVTLTTEWQRFEYISTSEDTNSGLWLKNSVGNIIHAWGSQLEEGSYATSYIPTQNTAQTRLSDECVNGGNEQVINSSEGVLYVLLSDIKSQNFDSIIINNGIADENNQVRIWFYNNTITYQYKVGSNASAQITTSTMDLTLDTKIACSWKLNEFKLFINGSKINEDLSGNVLANNTLESVEFKRGNNTGNFYGNVKDVKVYNTALSDSELASLTQV